MSEVLIVRPPPGGDETAARARSLGLDAVVAPIFRIRRLIWKAPSDPVEAMLLTSANAAREAGDTLRNFLALPCYAVGPATAAAADKAGFADIRIGPSDGEAVVAMMAADGIGRALHLCGATHVGLEHPRLALLRRTVYASDPLLDMPAEAVATLHRGALVLLHSPRGAAHFADLVDAARLDRSRVSLAAISCAARDAAGTGWRETKAAREPRDAALLELAAKLCQTKAER